MEFWAELQTFWGGIQADYVRRSCVLNSLASVCVYIVDVLGLEPSHPNNVESRE